MVKKTSTACTPPTALPIIDLTPFLPTSATLYTTPEAHLAAKLTTAAALNCACRDVGFFYLTGHGVPEEQRGEVLQEAKNWFLGTNEKEKQAIKRWDIGKGPGGAGDGARGYQRVGENATGGMKVRPRLESLSTAPRDGKALTGSTRTGMKP